MSTELVQVQCPYCGERIEVEVDLSAGAQNYIEDCSVCCRPIQFDISPSEDGPHVDASRSD